MLLAVSSSPSAAATLNEPRGSLSPCSTMSATFTSESHLSLEDRTRVGAAVPEGCSYEASLVGWFYMDSGFWRQRGCDLTV